MTQPLPQAIHDTLNQRGSVMLNFIDRVYYRYNVLNCASGIKLELQRIPVFKQTAKGVWLGNKWDKRFVLNDSRKKYAYPTESEALEGFIRRKQRYLAILRSQMHSTRIALEIAQSGDLSCCVDTPLLLIG